MELGEAKTKSDLGWEIIVDAVSARMHCQKSDSLPLPIANNYDDAKLYLSETAEALHLLESGDPLSFGAYADVDAHLNRLERDAPLDLTSLRQVADLLAASRELRNFLSQRRAVVPCLHRRCSFDPSLDSAEDTLGRCIGSDGLLKDDASPELKALRTEVHNLRSRIVRRLEALIQKHAGILQDKFMTLHEGRYVLPVRTDAHERLPGIVHATSASGATLFVEPEPIVERGNRLKVAQAQLNREEARILATLSSSLRDVLPSLRAASASIEYADLRSACARFGRDTSARVLKLAESPILKVSEAKHPLLLLEGESVIPNDFEIRCGEALVLSGPNAGGKTVALKTIGLFAMMMRAGLPLPAAEGSEVGFFSTVLSSVGDDQSLARHLSTYTAQMTHVVNALSAAEDRVLVLLDELASATEPEAGSVLACVIIEELCRRGAAVCATTHYERVKAMAADHSRMRNAAVGFDMEKMAPTYRVIMGVPGASSALSVAENTGVPEDVIEKARAALPHESIEVESLTAQLHADLQRVRSERSRVSQAQSDLDSAIAKQHEALEKIRARDHAALSEESAEIMARLSAARVEIKAARKAWREARNEADFQQAQQRLRKAAGAVDEVSGVLPDKFNGSAVSLSSLQIGDRVWVQRLRSEAEVIDAPKGDRIRVSAGMMKLWVDASDLRSATTKSASQGATPRAITQKVATRREQRLPPRSRDNTLDVRGLRAEDAIGLTEAFLDRMYGASEPQAYILHGVGSGGLRNAIHAHLAGDQHYVDGYWEAGQDEGGRSLTVVALK